MEKFRRNPRKFRGIQDPFTRYPNEYYLCSDWSILWHRYNSGRENSSTSTNNILSKIYISKQWWNANTLITESLPHSFNALDLISTPAGHPRAPHSMGRSKGNLRVPGLGCQLPWPRNSCANVEKWPLKTFWPPHYPPLYNGRSAYHANIDVLE